MPVPVSPLSSSVTSTAADADERMNSSLLHAAPTAPSTPLTTSTPPARESALLVLQSAGVSLSLLSEKFAFHLTKALLSSHSDTFTRLQLDAIHAATWSALIRAASDCSVSKSHPPSPANGRYGYGTPQKGGEHRHNTSAAANTTAALSRSSSPAGHHAHTWTSTSRSMSVLSTPQPNPSLKMRPTPHDQSSSSMQEDSKSASPSPSSSSIRTPPSAKTAAFARSRGTPVRLFSTAVDEKENAASPAPAASLPPPHTPPSRASTPAASILRAPLDLAPLPGPVGLTLQQPHHLQLHPPSPMRVASSHATPSALRTAPVAHAASPARARMLEESVKWMAFATSKANTPVRFHQQPSQNTNQQQEAAQQPPRASTTAAATGTSDRQPAPSISSSPAPSPAKSARPSSSPSTTKHRPLHSDSDTDDEALLNFQMRVPDSPPRRGGYGNEKINLVTTSTHVPSYPNTPSTPQDLSASMRSQLKYDRHRYSDVKQPKYVSDSDPDTSDYDY